MSYDISLFDQEFLQRALAEGLGNWMGAPPISTTALDALRSMLSAEGFAREQGSSGEHWAIDSDAVLAEVTVFPGQVAFSIPFSSKAEKSLRLCEHIARATSSQHGLGYYDPQSASPEDEEALQRSALEDLAGADPARQRVALEILASCPLAKTVEAVVQNLADGSDLVRPASAECLVAIFSEKPELASAVAISSLGRALSDPLVPTRTFAANALAVLGGRSAPAEKALERALNDESYGPRGYAKLALDVIARSRALD
jgi:hypothetical protein